MELYPYKFGPIYVEKIWGGRNLERLFGRALPAGKAIGESWELADLRQGVSVVRGGSAAGATLAELTRSLGEKLLGGCSPQPDGRFPLLLKLLDANDILSLQVHPDAAAVGRIGGDAALKTECWYVVESRGGFIYKGVKAGVTPERFRSAIESDTVGDLVRRIDVAAGDFHYLPAGTVHALGAGVVVAEVQTPSDTTYRVTDWGRGREIHVERSMECIRFEPAGDVPPGRAGETLLVTEYFVVALRAGQEGRDRDLPTGRCTALMILQADAPVEIHHGGGAANPVTARAGDTVLVPAGLGGGRVSSAGRLRYLEITLPQGRA
ncbi:MAG TPA: type I phosphomannose isomerase catalytic subunit [Phycisphaerae bacterium]|nr:type I phosphomannose isomerase catalytic subunit [Phycisphaerae bacterium]